MRTRPLTASALLLLLLLLLATRDARAAETARLVYARAPGAAGCPDEDALRRAVGMRVGYDPFFPWAQRTVTVSIVRRMEKLVARIELVDEQARSQGARELASAGLECGPLFDTVALAIAIAVDPQSLAPAAEPTPTPRVSVTPTPSRPISPPEVATTIEEPRPRESAPARASGAARARVGAFGVATVGTAPAPAVGVALFGGAAWSFATLDLEARLDAPAGARTVSGGRFDTWLAVASFVPCAHFGRIFVCGVASAGRVEATAKDVPSPRTESAGYVAFGGRAGVMIPASAVLAVRIHGDVVANASRATVRLDDKDVWTAPVLAVGIGIGLTASF